ncbi:MAG TPA: hypothetical protein VFV10_11010 [Gammaproteobacteria bacterium]|nr:hypothetical protein [Gammaproteobacteria bacterium]
MVLNNKWLRRGGTLASLTLLGLIAGCNANNQPGQDQNGNPNAAPGNQPPDVQQPAPNESPNGGAGAPNEAAPPPNDNLGGQPSPGAGASPGAEPTPPPAAPESSGGARPQQ